MNRKTVRLTLIALVVTMALALVGCPGGSPPGAGTTSTPPTSGELPDDTVALVKDAVVLVKLALALPNGQYDGTGSGFFISEDGYIVTNQHVISHVQHDQDGTPLTGTDRAVSVVLHSGTADEETIPAVVVREHRDIDLALLKVGRRPDALLDLTDSDAVKETSRIYACGHPLGLPEISIRPGAVSAHRTWNNHPMIEHDADIENGNSGGPIVDANGQVVAVTVLRLRVSYGDTKLAIPANLLRDWLAAPPEDDPPPMVAATDEAPLAKLLNEAGLIYQEQSAPGVYTMDFENGTTVAAHEYQEFLRVFCSLGPLPGTTTEGRALAAFDALRLTYDAPVGKYSINETDGGLMLYWEELVPMFAVTPEHVFIMAQTGSNEAARWQQRQRGDEMNSVEHLFPEGDEAAQLGQLERLLEEAKLKYSKKDASFRVPYDNGVEMGTKIFRGLVYTYCQIGGLPPGAGASDEEYGNVALGLLKRNYTDTFGRLALDDDGDVVWESQIPIGFLTPDYLSLVTTAGAGQVAGYVEVFGDIPFSVETEDGV